MTMMCTGKVSPHQLTPTAHYYVCGASPSPRWLMSSGASRCHLTLTQSDRQSKCIRVCTCVCVCLYVCVCVCVCMCVYAECIVLVCMFVCVYLNHSRSSDCKQVWANSAFSLNFIHPQHVGQ